MLHASTLNDNAVFGCHYLLGGRAAKGIQTRLEHLISASAVVYTDATIATDSEDHGLFGCDMGIRPIRRKGSPSVTFFAAKACLHLFTIAEARR
jgi:hypothetical protein